MRNTWWRTLCIIAGLGLAQPARLWAATDTAPPTIPTNVRAVASTSIASKVTVSWDPSTDNVKVSDYRITRTKVSDGSTVNFISSMFSTATIFNDTSGVTPQTQYRYTISAYDTSGNYSPPSVSATVTTLAPDVTPPPSPTNLRVTILSSFQAEITWNAVTDAPAGGGTAGGGTAIRYRLWRDGIPTSSTTTTASIIKSVEEDLSTIGYLFQVAAEDESGNKSPPSAEVLVTKLAPDVTPPSVPRSFAATLTGPRQASLSWAKSNDPDIAGAYAWGVGTYRVLRDGAQIAEVPSSEASTFTYEDTTLALNTKYTYAVSAVDKTGNVSALSTTVNVQTPATGFDFTLELSATALTIGQGVSTPVTVTLTRTQDPAQEVTLSTPAGGSLGSLTRVFSVGRCTPSCSTVLTITPPVTMLPQTGTLTVTASVGAMKKSLSIAITVVDLTPPAAPAELTGVADSSSIVRLAWQAGSDNVGVNGYRVIRDGTEIAIANSLAYEDTDVQADTTYVYTVKTADDQGNVSAASNAVPVTPRIDNGEIPEYWATHNKDGHWRNSNPRPLQGSLRVRWARTLTGLTPNDYDTCPDDVGMRSNTVSIRDGKLAVVVPSDNPDALRAQKSELNTYGTFALRDGQPLTVALSPHAGGGTFYNARCAAVMDTDTATGIIAQYWKADGTLFTAHGGDHNRSSQFNTYTGEFPFGASKVALTGCPNSAGYFAMTDANPLMYAKGGACAHSPFDGGAGAGLIGIEQSNINAMKMYASFIVEGNWVYPLNVTDIISNVGGKGFGVKIGGEEFSASPFQRTRRWAYTEPERGFLTFGDDHINGAPRAYALGEDGRIYYYGYKTWNGPIATAPVQEPDFAQGVFVTGIRSTDGISDVDVRIDYNPTLEYSNAWAFAKNAFPQIATRGRWVVVFQPQQRTYTPRGRVFAVDTRAKQLTWRHEFPTGYFKTNVVSAGTFALQGFSPEQAVQMTIAGDELFIVDPSVEAGLLQLRVERFQLADGQRTTTVLPVRDQLGQPVASTVANSVALRELAAVDGMLVALVDYDKVNQVLVAIEGEAAPARDFRPSAVISAPVTGTPVHSVMSNEPLPPTNQFDTGAPIAFSSLGSLDPDGGTLTYRWDFGDGATSTEANPTHTYGATGTPGTVTPRPVTLIVTDDEGRTSAPALRLLAVRDVGAVRTFVLDAEADTFVSEKTPTKTNGAGTSSSLFFSGPLNTKGLQHGYVRFQLGAIQPSSIQHATLRLWTNAEQVGSLSSPQVLLARAVNATWSEATLTWSTAPAPGAIVGALYGWDIPKKTQTDLEIPVTAYLRAAGADGVVSFALESAQPTGETQPQITVSSREGRRAPQLLVRVGSPGYAPPVITQQPQDVTLPANGAWARLAIQAESVLGPDALSYHWELVDVTPVSTWIVNDTAEAKTTLVRFQSPGTYQVRCRIRDGLQETISRVVTITSTGAPDLLPPTIPQNPLFDVTSRDEGRLSWDAATDNTEVVGYQVFLVDGGAPFLITPLTEATIRPGENPKDEQVAAFDAAGNLSGFSREVALSNQPIAADTTPPIARLISPAAETTISGSVMLTAFVKDNDAVARVRYQLDDQPLPAPAPMSPYALFWDTTTVPDGLHTLSVQAWDAAGNTSTSAVVPITVSQVSGSGDPPVITSPDAAGGAVGQPFTYQITATKNPTSYGATGLPEGLAVNAASGLLSGTPTTAGTAVVTLRAANVFGLGTKTLTLTITGLRGDLTGDGRRLLDDVRLLLEMLMGSKPVELARADLDGDGQVLLSDLRALILLLIQGAS